MTSLVDDTHYSGCILVGPTAAGKTDVAHFLARSLGADILSADALLVYRGMDIGTAKPSDEERSGIRYGGIDLADPHDPFSVGAYRTHALEFLSQTDPTRHAPLIVGGTGLYVKSLTHGLDDMPEIDAAVREEVDRLYAVGGIEALQHACRTEAPSRYEGMKDANNPRRLMRVLELARMGFEPAGACWQQTFSGKIVGLNWERDLLNRRIARRVDRMYEQGLLDEVTRLRGRYGALSDTARMAIGYQEAGDVLDGRCSLEEAKAETVRRTRKLVRRQMTWFRNQFPMVWVNVIDETEPIEQIAGRVAEAWRTYGHCTLIG